MPEMRHQKTLIKNLDQLKIVVIFPHLEKSPISCALVKNASCLKPGELIFKSNHNQLKMKKLLHLVNIKILNESQSDLAL